MTHKLTRRALRRQRRAYVAYTLFTALLLLCIGPLLSSCQLARYDATPRRAAERKAGCYRMEPLQPRGQVETI